MVQAQHDTADIAAGEERVEDAPRPAPAPRGGRFGWRRLAELDAMLREERKIRLLTPEARVLLHLYLSGPVPVSAAMQVAGTSYRGFYTVLGRLKLAGLVATEGDARDQRVRRLRLDPTICRSWVES